MISGADFVVRVFRDGALQGGGFPITADLVLTCAHVVGQESAKITIDAPTRSGERKYEATVAGWRAPQRAELGNAAEDLCVLQLTKEKIPGFGPPVLVVACDILGDSCRTIGFPNRYDGGMQASPG